MTPPRTLVLPLLLAACLGGPSGRSGPSGPEPPPGQLCTFINPVLATGADPWVVRSDGAYYFIESRDGGIWVYRSTALTNLRQNGVKIWQAPAAGWNSGNVWAPELHSIDGRWYVYYAAGTPGAPFIHQRAGVLESAGADPQGAYADRGRLDTGGSLATRDDDVWAIDLTVGVIGGQLYAIWSGWTANAVTDATPQQLYIARMASPTTMATSRVQLSAPVEAWERGGPLDLQEGPTLLTHAGHVFVIYSTRESWTKDYRLGQLRLADGGADPLLPDSWTKSGPVFTGAGTVYGVGHASFTTSPDGTESWIVYHSKRLATDGWDDRLVRTQRFGWKADGSPDFGAPTPDGQSAAVPSGQCP